MTEGPHPIPATVATADTGGTQPPGPASGPGGLLRDRTLGAERVTLVEIFFDLVYVFAVTQLSHLLLAHLGLRGAAHMALLLLAVWWAWMFTVWATNWYDPDRPVVRVALIVGMMISLVMAAALPEAFGARGLLFAAAYTTFQVGRNVLAVANVGPDPALRANLMRVLAWSVLSGAAWIAGGFAHATGAREAWWIAAVALDYVAPWTGFRTPGLGRSTTDDWTVAGHHIAERCQMFLIVAFGESVVMTGATFAGMRFTPGVVAASVTVFLGTAALWWLYFDRAAERAQELITSADVPGELARSAYTYLHLPMVAGIIVSAVADELVISHPAARVPAATATVIVAGPGLFLAGYSAFKRAVFGRWSPGHLAAVGVLALLTALAAAHLLTGLRALGLAAAAAAVAMTAAADGHIRARRIRP